MVYFSLLKVFNTSSELRTLIEIFLRILSSLNHFPHTFWLWKKLSSRIETFANKDIFNSKKSTTAFTDWICLYYSWSFPMKIDYRIVSSRFKIWKFLNLLSSYYDARTIVATHLNFQTAIYVHFKCMRVSCRIFKS